jgi:hypothetical protein
MAVLEVDRGYQQHAVLAVEISRRLSAATDKRFG